MKRPSKVTSSRSTPRPSTRSQQHSPPRSKVWVAILKKSHNLTPGGHPEVSDNDNESVCSSSKSSDVVVPRPPLTKGKSKDETGGGKITAPWRHPDELDYFRPYDWSEDKIITNLRGVVYSVPQPVNGKQSFIEITVFDDGDFDKPTPIKVPRGYRVPLMFVAKFQWASLKLVLTSAQREKEWSDYKFDILHLSRLCSQFFIEARAACEAGIVEIPPIKNQQAPDGSMSRKWRCPTFDRALARYNKNWLISREEFVRDFYIEFEDEEYVKDVLKIDWSRWALRGHKGFKLTQDELKSGIDGRVVTRGLKKDNNGKWIWVDEYYIKQEEVAAVMEPLAPDHIVSAPSSPAAKEAETSHPSDQSIPQTDGRAASEGKTSTITTLATTQTPSRSTPPRPLTYASSDSISENTARQPSPFVEKFHSPLSSLPSSASPSEVPGQAFDQHQTGIRSPSPRAHSPNPQTSPNSSTVLPSQPLVNTAPTRASGASQPPRSQTSPTPDRRPQNDDAKSRRSSLIPVGLGTTADGQSQNPMDIRNKDLTPEREVSPTSIDSTPNPSPAIRPQSMVDLTQPLESSTSGVVSMDISAVSVSQESQHQVPRSGALEPSELELDKSQPIMDPDSPPGSPYGPSPPREPHTKNGVSEPKETTKTPVLQEPSALKSALLPPPTREVRSSSPDEIPGLGGLSTRRPSELSLHFVPPKMTARTVTDGSSWLGLDDILLEPKQEVHEPVIPMALDNEEQRQTDVASPTAASSTHRPATRDDDSDMDFGTPEPCPVIIVPDPPTDDVATLPSPSSPCTLPEVPLSREDLPGNEMNLSKEGFVVAKALSAQPEPTAAALTGSTLTAQATKAGRLGTRGGLPRSKKYRNFHAASENGPMSSHGGLDTSTNPTPPNDPQSPGDSAVVNDPVSSQPATLIPSPTSVLHDAPGPSASTLPASDSTSAQGKKKLATTPFLDDDRAASPSKTRWRQLDWIVSPGTEQDSRLSSSDNRQHPPQTPPMDTDTTTHIPFQSTPRQAPLSSHTSPGQIGSFTDHQPHESPLAPFSTPQSTSMSRKRQREDGSEDEGDEEMSLKSRKRGEGLSIREGGVVVRKVVTMVRDTLTGLNDLLEIAAEQDIIPTSQLSTRSKGKGKAMDTSITEETPLYSPTTSSPLSRTPVLSRIRAESPEVTRLNRELQSLKAELVYLREKSTSAGLDTAEPDHVRAMRKELDMLREQVRVLKEAKATSSEALDLKTMRDELSTLRIDIRSLQDSSRRLSASSTPSTPNLTFRFNSHTMAHTVHPLAHLLAVEPDTTGADPQADGNGTRAGPSRQRSSGHARAPEPRTGVSSLPPRPPFFDDIPLPVKSKRKARMIFSRT